MVLVARGLLAWVMESPSVVSLSLQAGSRVAVAEREFLVRAAGGHNCHRTYPLAHFCNRIRGICSQQPSLISLAQIIT